jgi:hypothetical protein
MNVNVRHLVTALLIISLIACKKQSGQPGGSQNNNNNNNGGVQQGNYSGQKLTLSTAEKVVSPWVEVSEDSVYSSYGALSSLFKTIPTGFNDKIVSFYLPKGYLAVFAANPDGTGESACFVALDNPIKANLPARLRNNISYIRYIKFNNPEKKGTCSTNDVVVQNFGAQWHYTWAINKSSFTNQQFVPMTWGKGTCTDDNAKYLIERKDVDHMLSFNEPDHAPQSNVPVDTAIVRYKIMQKTGLRLGSPVTTQDQAFGAGKWLTDFMAKAQAQKMRINYIAVHWYDWGNETNNAATDSLTAERVFSRFVTYIQRVRQEYPNHPIWVTEYNANRNRTSEVVHKYFMKLSTEWMNSTPYVERYSYFFPPTLPGANDDNSLTGAGAYWKSLPSTKAFTENITLDATLVN